MASSPPGTQKQKKPHNAQCVLENSWNLALFRKTWNWSFCSGQWKLTWFVLWKGTKMWWKRPREMIFGCNTPIVLVRAVSDLKPGFHLSPESGQCQRCERPQYQIFILTSWLPTVQETGKWMDPSGGSPMARRCSENSVLFCTWFQAKLPFVNWTFLLLEAQATYKAAQITQLTKFRPVWFRHTSTLKWTAITRHEICRRSTIGVAHGNSQHAQFQDFTCENWAQRPGRVWTIHHLCFLFWRD